VSVRADRRTAAFLVCNRYDTFAAGLLQVQHGLVPSTYRPTSPYDDNTAVSRISSKVTGELSLSLATHSRKKDMFHYLSIHVSLLEYMYTNRQVIKLNIPYFFFVQMQPN